MASGKKYDIVFIDHMMPDMDGIETLKELRRMSGYAGTVCVALTANAVSGAREMYLSEVFLDYLLKPVDGEKLERMLLRYLPAEKVHKVEPEDAEPSDKSDVRLPEKIYSIAEIDTARGLEHCGTPEVYLETLSVYESTAAA